MSEQIEAAMNALGSSSKDTILADVLFYIDHNFQNNIKLETIAPLFGYNSAYLGKIFTKSVGESFNSYVDHRRIEHAKKLLLENRLKVYEIAEQVGYKNVDYFHKKFRKYMEMSPAEFRKGQGLDEEPGVYPPPLEKPALIKCVTGSEMAFDENYDAMIAELEATGMSEAEQMMTDIIAEKVAIVQ